MFASNSPSSHAALSSSSSVPRALSPGVLRIMAVEGSLSPEAYEAALLFLGIRPGQRHWNVFWRSVLGFWGALFFAAGVICFFAYNWADMHHFLKFALIASLILISGGIAIWRGLDSLPGNAGLLLASLCAGPLLAVYGQVYQSGADAWELFRAWTLAMLPLACVGRQAALWLLLWLAGSAWGTLYLGSLPIRSYYTIPGVPEVLLAQTLVLAGWEAVSYRWKNKAGHAWMQAAWFPRCIGVATLFALTCNLAWRMLRHRQEIYDGYLFLPEGSTCVVLYGVLLAGGWLWYRKVRPDLLMISCGLFSLAVLLLCMLIAHITRWDAWAFFLLGSLLAGITAGCGLLLRRLHHAMELEKAANSEAQSYTPGFFAQHGTSSSWDALWDHLRTTNLLTVEAPRIPASASAPWYVAALIAAGGWVSACFLTCFLALFVYMTLGIRSESEIPLFLGGIVFLVIARLFMRRESIFLGQFALALALTGTLAIAGAVVMASGYTPSRLLVLACMIAALYPFMHNSAYRHIAAIFGLLSFFLGLNFLIESDMFSWRHARLDNGKLYVLQALHALWYAFLSVAMSYGWLTEQKWRTNARMHVLLPPLLRGMYCVLLVSVVFSLLNRSMGYAIHVFEHLQGMLGIGPGIGLVCCASMMTKTLYRTSTMRLFFWGLIVLALIGGWFLPGISVGLLGLTLGRYRGDLVALGVTIAALVAYFFCYYYNLDTTLLYKSQALMGSGALLCAGGFCMHMLMQCDVAAACGRRACVR